MTFDELLDHAIAMLRKRGRVSYRVLKLQFQLDDDYVEALREELTAVLQLATDQDSKVLIWTGGSPSPPQSAQHGAEAESRFHALFPAVSV